MVALAYTTDVLLVDRCLTGDVAATRELFRLHRGRVHACLYRVLGANQDVDDLMQEAFVQVFQSLSRWRAEASLATWIDRITVRVAYRYLGQRRRRGPVLELVPEDPALATPSSGPSRQLAREGVRRLYRVLDGLSPTVRVAFSLHELEGRPMSEVASLLGATVTATKVRVWRARRAIDAAAAADPVLAEFLVAAGGES